MTFIRMLLILATCSCLASVLGQETPTGTLTVIDPWSRATVEGARVGVVFCTIRNTGTVDDHLVGARCDLADTAELHTHTRDAEGVMRMRPVERISVPAGGIAELKPGSYHLMLMGLHRALVAGERIPVRLTFALGGEVTTEVTVGSIAASGPETNGQATKPAAAGEHCPLCDAPAKPALPTR